jgi:hypothetical protein
MVLKLSLSFHLPTVKQRSHNGSRNVNIFVPFAPSLLQSALNQGKKNVLPLLYNTGLPLMTFHPFPKFPANLRARVSTHAVPAVRTRFLEHYGYSAPICTPKIGLATTYI